MRSIPYQLSPDSESLVTPERTITRPLYSTAQTNPVVPTLICETSHPDGVVIAVQRKPSGELVFTPVLTITLPCAVIAQTDKFPADDPGTLHPPMATSMNGSSVGSLCNGATAHHEFKALYRRYLTHLRRLTHEFHFFSI